MELPRYVQIEPVGQCNLRCQMCSIQYRRDGMDSGPPAFMTWSLFEHLLDQFPDLEHLHLQGLGEPMMHPRFFDMVHWAAERGVRVTTNTNLTLLSPRRAKLCISSQLECAHVSIDGATAATYEGIRRGARYHRVVQNLKLLQSVKNEMQAKTPRLILVMVLMRQNLHELPDLVRQTSAWGNDSLFVQHLCHEYGEAGLPERYRPMRTFVQRQSLQVEDRDRVRRIFAAASRVAEELEIELRLPSVEPREHPVETPGPERCDWPWRGAYFSYDGYAMPCCMISTPDRMQLGQSPATPAAVVWNGESYETFRRQLASETPPEVCQSCAIYRGIF
jgi:MoaA/NifB/PqqE/SkfB family radical SAM enzyme